VNLQLPIFKYPTYLDERGLFSELYKESLLKDAGITARFVQDNFSRSKKGVIRGLHCQLPPYEQGKLVRVVKGSVWDVAVDIRVQSPTFGEHFAYELTESGTNTVYIPPGFVHGFLSLQEDTFLFYKCTNEYHKQSESGILFDDSTLQIPWPKLDVPYIVSEKDLSLPSFSAFQERL